MKSAKFPMLLLVISLIALGKLALAVHARVVRLETCIQEVAPTKDELPFVVDYCEDRINGESK
jgi:hypothetical protein